MFGVAGCKLHPDLGYQLEILPLASSKWASSKHGSGVAEARVFREPAGSFLAFYNPALEVILCHFCYYYKSGWNKGWGRLTLAPPLNERSDKATLQEDHVQRKILLQPLLQTNIFYIAIKIKKSIISHDCPFLMYFARH